MELLLHCAVPRQSKRAEPNNIQTDARLPSTVPTQSVPIKPALAFRCIVGSAWNVFVTRMICVSIVVACVRVWTWQGVLLSGMLLWTAKRGGS